MGQLAQKIRAKFPGAYDNIDDATLEIKVADKYPQYRSMVSAPLDPAKMGQPREAPVAVPGMGQIPDQTGRGGQQVGLQPQVGVQPKPPSIRDMVNNPVSEFMSKPIASHLPQSAQDYLATRQPNTLSMDRTPAGMEDMPNPTGSANLYKAALQTVNPGQVAAGVGTVMGGVPGLIANSALGIQGGLEATDPNRTTGERVMGGISGLAGLAGAIPGLKSIPGALRKAGEGTAAKKVTSLSPEVQKLQDAFETALSAKNKVTYPKGLQEDFKLGMEGKDAQFAVRAKAEADAAAQGKASGIMGHFDDLSSPEARKIASAEARRLGLAKSQQDLETIASRAESKAPGYFEAPKAGASSTPAKAIEEVKVPTVDEVMFTPPEIKQRPKPMSVGPEISETRFQELMGKLGGKGPDVPPKAVKPKLSAEEFLAKGGSAKGAETPAITPNAERLSLSTLKRERDALEAMPEGMPDHPNHAAWSNRYDVVDDLITRKDPGFNDFPPRSSTSPAEDLAARLGTPPDTTLPKGKTKLPRTEDVLRSNPRFQALSKEERAARYKELGGADAEARKVKVPKLPDEGIDPSKLYSGLDPSLLKHTLKVPAVRAALGGAVGSQVDEKHPYLGAGLGAAAGLMAAPNKYGGMKAAIDNLTALRYEALLSGAPQVSNVAGNVGGTLSAPLLEALRGNIGGAKDLAKSYLNPNMVPEWLQEFTQSWKSKAPITRFGTPIKSVGPAGRTLQAVDTATKSTLAKGGLSPELAGHYTLSALPSTDTGKILKKAQSIIPGGQIISPFVNTATKALEMAGATSPLRLAKGLGKNLRTMVPTQDYVTKGGTKIPKTVFEALMSLPAPVAFGAGLSGVQAPGEGTIGQVPASALLGPFALPYMTGRGIRDYAKYGRDNPRDIAEAVMNNVPLAGDIPKDAQNPSKLLTDIPAQFIPQFLTAMGDKTVRETKADKSKDWYNGALDEAENSIRSRLPWERASLPAKRTFLGDEKVRNFLGQYPAADYNTDPLAARLADVEPTSLLRRSPNQSLGGLSPKARLMQMGVEKQFQGKPELQALVESLTSLGNTTTNPAEESRLGELRGKSVRADLTPIVGGKGFTNLPKEIQDILLELMVSNAHSKGTKAFKTERSIEAVKKAKP